MKITDFFSLEDFSKTIPFTALGARVCYNDGDLQSLLNDPRVVDKQTRAGFLSKLGNYKHFSVFSHSFAYKKIGELNALKIAATKFKSHYNPKYPDVIGVSLRHYLEELLEIDPQQYLKAFEKIAEFDVPINPLGQKENVSLIGLITEYDGYAVFFIDKVSRTLTHQLVRHTALNFSQRSQRYVKEEENFCIISPSVKESQQTVDLKSIENLKDLFNEILQIIKNSTENTSQSVKDSIQTLEKRVNHVYISKSMTAYEIAKLYDELSQLIYDLFVHYFKIKREDARFFLPNGRRTTIVVSGTLSWIKDFIQKRNTPHAQWEIRSVAQQMQKLLEEQGV
ncbi:FAD-dependent thymidylate synthase [Sulfurihydrogenibium subterraneum]|uniref:FAD-dependent thymidylate synthase n=1 Tax=Sulfurihydrogenibium subterraneum TaxID=171121 RepID=UPI00048AACA1|nr:FAD-dependent thymidylate synthase [Sulfurihydrogenibium subterraneum]